MTTVCLTELDLIYLWNWGRTRKHLCSEYARKHLFSKHLALALAGWYCLVWPSFIYLPLISDDRSLRPPLFLQLIYRLNTPLVRRHICDCRAGNREANLVVIARVIFVPVKHAYHWPDRYQIGSLPDSTRPGLIHFHFRAQTRELGPCLSQPGGEVRTAYRWLQAGADIECQPNDHQLTSLICDVIDLCIGWLMAVQSWGSTHAMECES